MPTLINKVVQHLERLERGILFYIDELYGLASVGSVHKAVAKLVQSGKVIRVSRGMYAARKPLPSIPSITVTTSPEKIARLWARKRGYRLASQGLYAAYRVGFQTQAPIRTVYWSDGPTREFRLDNAIVFICKTSAKKLRWADQTLGMLLRAIYVTNADYVELKDLHIAFYRLSIHNAEIVKTLKLLQEEPLPKKWISKLKSFEKQSTQSSVDLGPQ
ncbi:DUF6088 family protein [Agaribacterium sp. ZY112]|uniref:DUF6088 family protein n=1 Tax=Agaribacterium sp. ZY112 TaxID=3233574 RepID=UPI003523798D